MTPHKPDPTRAAELLLDGVAPERKDELRDLWAKDGPEFRLLDDDGPDGSFGLDAGAYRLVRFNHRVLRLSGSAPTLPLKATPLFTSS
jgi:hypothetical protein